MESRPSQDTEVADNKIKEVEAEVGDVLIFDLPMKAPEGENAGTMEWVFLEGVMGWEGDTYSHTSENMKVNEDGSWTWSFGFEVTRAGDDIISFV